MRPKIKYFQKIIILKKKKKRKKPRMTRRRRRVRTEERSVEFEDREFEKEGLRQFVVLVVPYEQP